MADTVASPLLLTLSDRLSSVPRALANGRILKHFQQTLSEIQTLVCDAENILEDSDALCRWVTEVKQVAYEAEGVLDEFDYSLQKYELRMKPFLYCMPSPLYEIIFYPHYLCLKLELMMKDLEKQLRCLLRRRINFQKAAFNLLRKQGGLVPNPVARLAAETTSFVLNSEVFGRGSDKENLVRQLIDDQSSSNQLNAVAIVGMGGIGKTTLAQLVFNDDRVCSHFDYSVWVSVGENLDVKMIGNAISEHLHLTMEEMVNDLIRNTLGGRRFLIVLDDVWSEEQEKWSILGKLFKKGMPGSAVLMTTRNERVPFLMASSSVKLYRLKPLCDEDAWSLFKHIAFGSLVEVMRVTNFTEMGHSHVINCKGLPLAVKALAYFVRCRQQESVLQRIKEDNIWIHPELESCVLPALKRSYNHLPPHLKQCFAYCAVLPFNDVISKENLIQLWIAEGLVQPIGEHSSLEDIANDYFMELVRCSFLMEIERDDYGDIVTCQMHDSVHHLARAVSRLGSSIVRIRAKRNLPAIEVQHSCLDVFDYDERSTTLPFLRTLLLSFANVDKVPGFVFKLRCLRTLDLSGNKIIELPKSIRKLKHLRFLNLSQTQIATLPESIGELPRLYTLELRGCSNLQKLPESICVLTNLRNLDITLCFQLSHMPSQIGRLKLLRKLTVFILSKIDGCGKISELKELDLKGKLEIMNLECVGSPDEAFDANLIGKENLCSLELSWNPCNSSGERHQVLENLKPPLGLKDLRITGYNSIEYPSWMTTPFSPNLVSFSLNDCSCEKLPPLGQLSNLKYLSIKRMPAVKIIDDKFYGGSTTTREAFPSLKEFELSDMQNLEKWLSMRKPEEPSSSYTEEKTFGCLEFLTISGCPNLVKWPSFPTLINLVLWDCHYKVLQSLDRQISLFSLLLGEIRGVFYLDPASLYIVRSVTIFDCNIPRMLIVDGKERIDNHLEQLRILSCSDLESLPEWSGRLTSLKKLEIVDCNSLTSLQETINNLISLEEVVIDDCPMLESLPNSIRYLTNLQKLVIRRCPKLKKRLQKQDNRQWPNLANILIIEEDG